jgi:hypothetical protein
MGSYLLFLQPYKKGPVAEWLGSALQKLLQRFESARDLKQKPLKFQGFFLFVVD